ncbi:MAG: glycogen synthase GlgA [Acidiferrobacteraceae bacterium]
MNDATSGLRVLYVASECAPWVKTGGLGDVVAALPVALRTVGIDARILLPAYPALRRALRCVRSAEYDGWVLYSVTLPSGVPGWLLEAGSLFDRDGGPYQDREGHDWPDNADRFALLSRVAAVMTGGEHRLPWRAQLLHCNDWQTGLAPAYLRLLHGSRSASLMTVHNLAFQGLFSSDTFPRLGLPDAAYAMEGLEFYGRVSFLKAGLQYADAITTVSPAYAREIQQAPLGFGMEGLLARRAEVLHGILNGIDTSAWDPARDPQIPAPYDCDRIAHKATNKGALQERLGLPPDPRVLLLGMVSRLTYQKGVDLVLAAGPLLRALPLQIALLGRGDADLEHAVRGFADAYPRQVAAIIGFDEDLAHLIEAGADAFLMPSRFEPCGLNQMYSQRYGTPPIAYATGGLVDTIIDFDATQSPSEGTGFLFREATPEGLAAAVQRAFAVYQDQAAWRVLQLNGMRRDFGWENSARRHAEIYRSVVTGAHTRDP